MNARLGTIIFLIIIMLFACEDPEITNFGIAVVNGYVHADKNLEHISVTKINAFSEDSLSSYALNSLEIVIRCNNDAYFLDQLPGDSGYYFYSGRDLLFNSGKTYVLEFEYNDELIRAQTLCPEKPVNMKLSASSISIERPDDGGSFSFFNNTDGVTLSWDNETDDFYYASVIAVDANLDTITSFFNNPSRFFSTPPISGDEFLISSRTIRFYGKHMVVLYKINQEFANMFENTGQGSMTLTEPATNIENGRGLFTGISSDTLYFNVIEK